MREHARRGFDRGRAMVLALSLLLAVVPAMSAAAAGRGGPPTDRGRANDGAMAIEVLSSPPEYVSGGDARLRITVPRGVGLGQVQVTVDGEDVTDAFAPGPTAGHSRAWSTGSRSVDNLVEARASGGGSRGAGRPVRVGGAAQLRHRRADVLWAPAGPLRLHHRGRPRRDRRRRRATAPQADPAEDCAMETLVSWIYRPAGATGGFEPYDPANPPAPEDVATTTTIDGEEIPFIVRWERGTINRFVYSIAIPSPAPQPGDEDDARRPVVVERPADLPLPGRGRHRPLPGRARRQPHAVRVRAGQRLRGRLLDRHQDRRALQPRGSAARPPSWSRTGSCPPTTTRATRSGWGRPAGRSSSTSTARTTPA